MRRSALMAAALAISALAGCGSSPKVTFYTLTPDAAAERSERAESTSYVIAIGPVTVPETIDRPQLVTRAAANQLTIDETARWAEPLKSLIPRTIAANLTQLLSGAYVIAFPQSAYVNADYRVDIDVQRFDSALGEAAAIELLWAVRPAKGAQKVGRAVAREPVAGKGYDALAAAHSRALSAASREIAEAIRSTKK